MKKYQLYLRNMANVRTDITWPIWLIVSGLWVAINPFIKYDGLDLRDAISIGFGIFLIVSGIRFLRK